jgi:hypothetical protein
MLVLKTTDAVTTRHTNTRAYFQCTEYDAAGTATLVMCSAGNKLCAKNGTVGCALHYRDVNVTSTLRPGQTVRLCNTVWTEFVAFDRVAFVQGSALAPYAGPDGVHNAMLIAETEAYALVQVLRTVDPTITTEWAIAHAAVIGCYTDTSLETNGDTLRFSWLCCNGLDTHHSVIQHVDSLRFEVTDGPEDALQRRLAMDENLVAALMNLPLLRFLKAVGRGSLLPQLGSLAAMRGIYIEHFCLQGQLPPQLLTAWSSADRIAIVGQSGYVDSENSEPCGVIGTLPARRSCGQEECNPGLQLILNFNRISGNLSTDLLEWGTHISLATSCAGQSMGSTRMILVQGQWTCRTTYLRWAMMLWLESELTSSCTAQHIIL